MKTKLNLTIDENLVPRSKAYAKKRGKSVSELVEELLRNATEKGGPTFSEKWCGRFSLQEKSDPRYNMLMERYQL